MSTMSYMDYALALVDAENTVRSVFLRIDCDNWTCKYCLLDHKDPVMVE